MFACEIARALAAPLVIGLLNPRQQRTTDIMSDSRTRRYRRVAILWYRYPAVVPSPDSTRQALSWVWIDRYVAP